MPRHFYRVRPALAMAFGVLVDRAGERAFCLRARSLATSVQLRLKPHLLSSVRDELLMAAQAYKTEPFSIEPMAPCPMTSPVLLGPFDLDSTVERTRVLPLRDAPSMALIAEGDLDAAPFQVEVWATPEQWLALLAQMKRAIESA